MMLMILLMMIMTRIIITMGQQQQQQRPSSLVHAAFLVPIRHTKTIHHNLVVTCQTIPTWVPTTTQRTIFGSTRTQQEYPLLRLLPTRLMPQQPPPPFQTTTTTLWQSSVHRSSSSSSGRSSDSRRSTSRSKQTNKDQPAKDKKDSIHHGHRPYHLVIVESPNKCQTIQNILQDYGHEHDLSYDFIVTACMGHIRDLSKQKQQQQPKHRTTSTTTSNKTTTTTTKKKNNKSKTTTTRILKSSSKTKTPQQHDDDDDVIQNKTNESGDSNSLSSSLSSSSASFSFPYMIAGIDLEHSKYEPIYEIVSEKQHIVQELCQLSSNAEQIWLATDPDREGEAMAWHIMQVIQQQEQQEEKKKNNQPSLQDTNNNKNNNSFFRRLSFTEITPQAIRQAIIDGGGEKSDDNNNNHNNEHYHHDHDPVGINPNLVQAQETRRILDRLYGFTMNPILWKKISPGLSAGRVQSVALALTVQRERERLVFESTCYTSIHVMLQQQQPQKQQSKQSKQQSKQSSMTTTSKRWNTSLEARLQTLYGQPVTVSGKDFQSQGQCLRPESSNKLHLTHDQAEKWVTSLYDEQHNEKEYDENDNDNNSRIQQEQQEQDIENNHNNDDDDNNVEWIVKRISSKRHIRSPPIPYRTSTLQQDAYRKLGMSLSTCMRMAQQLYENGWITYMRTDSNTLSDIAETITETTIQHLYGIDQYSNPATSTTTTTTTVDSNPKKKKKATTTTSNNNNNKKKNKKAKFAQEAHEAIRPTIPKDIQGSNESTANVFCSPNSFSSSFQSLSYPCQQLYEMIYQRVLASRMLPLITNITTIQIECRRRHQRRCRDSSKTTQEEEEEEMIVEAEFQATGRVVVHPGYTLAFRSNKKTRNKETDGMAHKDEEEDDNDSDDDDDDDYDDHLGKTLPSLKEGEVLNLVDMKVLDHTTKPPDRYTEASIVKKLEALGVGRPSTYARIVQVLRERCYVGNPTKALEPYQTQNGYRRSSSSSSTVSPQTTSSGSISARRAAGGDAFRNGKGGRRGGGGPLVPSLSAFVVCNLLETYCPSYVDPEFTAQMEERLDQIATNNDETMDSEQERIQYLDEFYGGENGLAATIKRIEDNVDSNSARRAMLPALMSSSRVDDVSNGSRGSHEPIDSNDNGQNSNFDVGLFVGPWGPFVQRLDVNNTNNRTGNASDGETKISAPLPSNMCADLTTITPESLRAILRSHSKGGSLLGNHPEDGRPILLKSGRYGMYLQWGDDDEEGTTTHSLPREKATMLNLQQDDRLLKEVNSMEDEDESDISLFGNQLSLDEAIGYVGLPRLVGHLEDKPVYASLGPYGPYLKVNKTYVSLHKKDADVLTVNEETALRLIDENKEQQSLSSTNPFTRNSILADLGEQQGARVKVRHGRYGPYVNWKKVNVKLPPNVSPSTVTLETAWALLKPKISKAETSSGSTKKRTGHKRLNSSSRSGGDTQPEHMAKIKRPRSAYLYFCQAKRPEVSKTISNFGEVAKELSRLWSETTDRREYEALADADKERYEKEKATAAMAKVS